VTRYALEPRPLSNYYSLDDVLYWVAFGQYSTHTSVFHSGYNLVDEIFLNELSRASSFRATSFSDKAQDIETILAKEGYVLPEVQEYPELWTHFAQDGIAFDSAEYLAWKQQFAVWQDEYNSALDHYLSTTKSKVFLKLKNGELVTYGRLKANLKENATAKDWNTTSAWNDIQYEKNDLFVRDIAKLQDNECVNGFQKIPATFWDIEGIQWPESEARSRNGWYQCIFCLADDLFGPFPEAEAKPSPIENRNGIFIFNAGDSPTNIQSDKWITGRKAKYDWPAFHAEACAYLRDNQVTTGRGGQAELEAHMMGWCMDHWGIDQTPQESQIRTYCSQHYKAYKAKKETIA
jgi:hypothetical protein